MSERSQEFSASFPYPNLFPDGMEQEIFQSVGSQDMHAILNSDLVDGPYNNDIYMHDQSIHDENTVAIEDFKTFLPTMPQLLPIPANSVISNEEYPGPHQFEVNVLPNYKSKNPWVFSSVLNKVYMDMSQQFPVDFKISNRPEKQLFIRTTPQYCAQQHALEPVARCIQHEYPADPTNKDVPEHVRQHVIRCQNKFSQYLGSKQETQRLSIIFPFSMPQVGVESVKEMFFFVCKSSCNIPGMNRRSTEVIFTLEDEDGTVLGRKCLNVRVCACPKRDKEKEESEHKKDKPRTPRGKKRKTDHPSANPAKVVPQEELKDYTLPLPVTGKHQLLKYLTFAEDQNLADITRYAGQPAEKQYRKNLAQIQAVKNSLQ